MTEMNKNEKQIAEAMNEYHWRAWLPIDDLAASLSKRASNLQTTLMSMVKRKLVEKKGIKDELYFRLTPNGRAKIKA